MQSWRAPSDRVPDAAPPAAGAGCARCTASTATCAEDALRDDPYLLTEPYFGADFAAVDAFALELDVEADDERRVEAGILFELSL